LLRISVQQLPAFGVTVRPKSGQGASSPPLVLSARTADLSIEATHPAGHFFVSLGWLVR
jgi:hypothetical protein